VLAIVPIRDGTLPAGGAETVAECAGRCLLIGSGVEAAVAELAHVAGLTTAGPVVTVEAGDYRPATWAAAIVRAIADGTIEPDTVLVLPASADGRDLAPRIAAELNVALFAGATAVDPAQVVLARDGGLHMHSLVPPPAFVATLQPGVRGVEAAPHGSATPPPSRPVALVLDETRPDPVVTAVLAPDAATIDLAEAHRILGGGAGLDSAERFDTLAEIGGVIGASVGATRVITDRGWIGHARQIGTTGVVVDPDLYLAFGISGAVQHTSGLGHPHHVISVNTEPHCPMMQLADLAVVADANAVLDELRALLVPPAESTAVPTSGVVPAGGGAHG